jgi:hypothetical protein
VLPAAPRISRDQRETCDHDGDTEDNRALKTMVTNQHHHRHQQQQQQQLWQQQHEATAIK